MKIRYLIIFCLVTTLRADYRIAFFFRTLPTIEDKMNVEQVVKESVHIPIQTLRNILTINLPSQLASGIFGTYAGYVAMASIFDGQMSFPRRQQSDTFIFIITPLIEPIIMLGKTVHHLELIEGVPASAYKVERKQDSETGFYYWQTTTEPLPSNKIIPLNSIVLFAQPIDINIPEGITLTSASSQLLLPDVFVRKSFNVVGNVLNLLKIKQFFEQTMSVYKKGSKTSWSSQFKY